MLQEGLGGASSGSVDPDDAVIFTAEAALFNAIDYLTEFWMLEGEVLERLHRLAGIGGSELSNAMAAFMRKVGRARATPEVLYSQLRILGGATAEAPQPVETAALNIFADVLFALDTFGAAMVAEHERRAAAESAKPAAPLPVEETTLETVSGPFDTWNDGRVMVSA